MKQIRGCRAWDFVVIPFVVSWWVLWSLNREIWISQIDWRVYAASRSLVSFRHERCPSWEAVCESHLDETPSVSSVSRRARYVFIPL